MKRIIAMLAGVFLFAAPEGMWADAAAFGDAVAVSAADGAATFAAGAMKAPESEGLSSSSPVFDTEVFQLDWKKDAVIVGADLALEIYHNLYDYFGTDNEWDGRVYDKSEVNAFDRALMHPYNAKIDTVATLMVAGTIAAPFFATAAFLKADDAYGWADIFTLFGMLGESAVLAHTAAHITKGLVLRTRPFMYYDSITESDEPPEDDWNRSFYSGHTTMTFAAATCMSYSFCAYFPDSPWKVPVVAGSYALAAATAVLRVYSGNHFATDVLVGAVTGTAIGFLVPWAHRVRTKDMTLALSPAGIGVQVKM